MATWLPALSSKRMSGKLLPLPPFRVSLLGMPLSSFSLLPSPSSEAPAICSKPAFTSSVSAPITSRHFFPTMLLDRRVCSPPGARVARPRPTARPSPSSRRSGPGTSAPAPPVYVRQQRRLPRVHPTPAFYARPSPPPPRHVPPPPPPLQP